MDLWIGWVDQHGVGHTTNERVWYVNTDGSVAFKRDDIGNGRRGWWQGYVANHIDNATAV